MKASRESSQSNVAAMPEFCEASLTYTTGPLYAGAIFNAVCIALVVAPPISSGVLIPALRQAGKQKRD